MIVTIDFNVRKIRKAKRVTLVELSEISEVSKSEISDIENGKKIPTLETLIRIAFSLQVPLSALYHAEIKK